MRRVASILLRSFLQGLLILSPIVVTAYVIYIVFDNVDGIIRPVIPEHVWVPKKGVGFFIIVSLITFIGYMGTRFFLGKMLFDAFDHLLQHIPGIKHIYSPIKDVMGSFVGDKKRFSKPVWVCINHNPEIWRIGFMTQQDLSYVGMVNKVAVYLPHSYAVSGYVIVAELKNIKPVTKMTAAEAMKFAVSGGITGTEEERHDRK